MTDSYDPDEHKLNGCRGQGLTASSGGGLPRVSAAGALAEKKAYAAYLKGRKGLTVGNVERRLADPADKVKGPWDS